MSKCREEYRCRTCNRLTATKHNESHFKEVTTEQQAEYCLKMLKRYGGPRPIENLDWAVLRHPVLIERQKELGLVQVELDRRSCKDLT